MHGATDLTGIAIIAVAATLCGMAMVKYRQPAIIGYILAGIFLGPSGLGFVTDRENINVLAELGVILLLYFIGMELSLRSFRYIWKLALFATAVQIGGSVLAVLGLTRLFGWPVEYAVLFGFCLALSSTAVAVKVLEGMGELRTRTGRITIGILIAQDLAVAPMLVVVSNLAGGSMGLGVLLEVALSVGLLVSLIVYLTKNRKKVNLPGHHLIEGKPDLAPLGALAWCFLLASIAGLFHMSPAFGAFLAGLIAGNSAQRKLVHEHAGPVQAVLLMVFFLSIGLLIDLGFLFDNFGMVLAMWLFVTIFKTALNACILKFQGEKWKSAISVSLVLGQLGEFSFVLGAAALSAAVIDSEIHRLLVIVTVLSLISSPIYTDAARRLTHLASQPEGFRATMKVLYVNEWALTRQFSKRLLVLWQRLAIHIGRLLNMIEKRTGWQLSAVRRPGKNKPGHDKESPNQPEPNKEDPS
ncbi:cation:proton antiporter [Aestuariispira insulae]|uniref:CPA2 family monovalent cation:H+ antiporter-2 n=1 Tax=Aestuariispira insulae TaxID=1461337 RepID=A0A3D9HGJ1_9PROT|nr:cation:proton antiporter [Aestuariispira insulae]RED48608.1 CPA2 family monovalent cation:H+ antiporter-2 [Aestuariispira insulae]